MIRPAQINPNYKKRLKSCNPYSAIRKDAILDRRLSWNSIGFFAYLQSSNNGQEILDFNEDVLSACDELVKLGYIKISEEKYSRAGTQGVMTVIELIDKDEE